MEDLNRDKPKYPNQQIGFSVPVTPSVNHMYIGKTKRLKKEAIDYIRTVQEAAIQAAKHCKWKKDSEHVWYYIDLYFYFPDKRIRDSHNCIKLLMDCMQGVLFHNDYYCMPRVQRVELDRENPHIDIIITPQEYK